VLAPSQFPDDEDTDGSRSVGLLALRTPDAAASPRTFTEFSRQEIFTLCNKARTWP